MTLEKVFQHLIYKDESVSAAKDAAVFALFQFGDNIELQNEDDIKTIFNRVKEQWSIESSPWHKKQLLLLPDAMQIVIQAWRDLG